MANSNSGQQVMPRARPPAPSIEDEMAGMVAADRRPNVGSPEAMDKIEKLLSNAVTAAHEDAGKALDRVISEARELMRRIEEGVEQHKQKLQKDGQVMASHLEAAVQALTTTVQWVEQQAPKLRNPQTDGQ
jgi:uncharacterized protein YicC (UPF0701 family)